MMAAFRKLMPPAGVFVLMGAIGWGLGTNRGAPDDDPEGGQKSEAPLDGRSLAKAGIRHESREADPVSPIRKAKSSEERLRATIQFARSLPLDQFPEWLGEGRFSFRSGFELRLFRGILERRWEREDPEGFAAWKIRRGRAGPGWMTGNSKEAILDQLENWAFGDPEKLDALFTRQPDPGLEADLIGRLIDDQPKLAIERLKAMLARGDADVSSYAVRNLVERVGHERPEEAEALLDVVPDQLRMNLQTALVGRRLADSFDSEFEALRERPDGWRLFSAGVRSGGVSGRQLLEALPDMPEAWKRQLGRHGASGFADRESIGSWMSTDFASLGFSDEEAKRLRLGLTHSLSFQAPETVLEATLEAGLTSEEREKVISRLFRYQSRYQGGREEVVEELLAMLDSESDRALAREQLQPAEERNETSRPNVREWTSETMIDGFLESDPEQVSLYQLGSAMRSWSAEDMTGLAHRIDGLSGDRRERFMERFVDVRGPFGHNGVPPEIYSRVVSYRAANAPAEGNETEQVTQDASRLASSWASDEPEAAATWAEGLPDGEAKRWARRNLARSWNQYDPEAVEQWMGTLKPGAREDVEEFLSGDAE